MRRAGCILAAAALLAQDYRVRPKPPRTPDVTRILSRTDATLDSWLGEQDYEAIHARLAQLAWPQEMLARFRTVTLKEAKIIASNRVDAAQTETDLRLRIELGGESRTGTRLSLLGHANAIFSRSPDGWTMRSFSPGPLRELASPGPFFTDVTAKAIGHNASYARQLAPGIDHWRTVLDEATGMDVYGHNGIAVGDYNGDGLEDFYICQPSGLPNRLFRNNGDGTFDDVTGEAGLDILDNSSMALFADFDNDGDQDLLVVTSSRPLLFRNNGKGRFFLEANSGLSPAAAGATLTSAAVADYDRDGFLDVYVCAYDFWTPGASYDPPTPYYDATNGPPNFLFRNRGDGTFEDVTAKAIREHNDRFSFAAAWGDYNRDGWPDLYVANDFGRNNLYRNNGDGTFTDVAAQAGVEDPGAGMSAAWGDYDNDGWLDLYTGNMWSSAGQRVTHNPAFEAVARDPAIRAAFQRQARGNSLFRNNRDGTFTDVTLDAGVEMGRWAWSSDFFDFDNDGLLDIFVQNGYITGPDTHDL
ncbi:MAG: VCBS repeat-containing protein [Acidobacteria bacterium]|nr:VCBS repeat-containing protein [Acidobacteriota bacterium]